MSTDIPRILKALGNETRLKLVLELHQQRRSVGDLAEKMGLTPAHVSQQLCRLRQSGVVDAERDAQKVFYGINSQQHRVVELLSSLVSLYSEDGLRAW